MNPEQQMEQRGRSQWSISVFEEEHFQGKCCHFTMECQNILDQNFRKIRSIKVENGPSSAGEEIPQVYREKLSKGFYTRNNPNIREGKEKERRKRFWDKTQKEGYLEQGALASRWVGYEYPEYQGQQFVLEKGDYPCYQAWSGNSSYRTEHLLSFRPIRCANQSDSKVSLYVCEDFQGGKFELSDDYPSLQAMGWCSKQVPSIKINSGAWVAYQFPGYRGYQYILERDHREGEFRKYTEFGTQAHTNQIQSIRRIQN